MPFLKLFQYASGKDLLLLIVANVMILYSSFNIPLVNIVYGLMMRSMNDFVANRAKFQQTDYNNITGTTTTTTTSYVDNTHLLLANNTVNGGHDELDQQQQQQQQLNHQALQNGSDSYHLLAQQLNSATNTSTTITETPLTLADAEHIFMDESYRLCMIVIVFGVTRLFTLYIGLLLFNIAAANQARRVKILFFRSLLRQEIEWFESNRTGDFAYRLTTDLSKFEEGIGEKIALCLNALFAWIASVVSSFFYGWELTLVCLILVPFTIIITTMIAEIQASYSIKESAALSRAFSVCHEVLSSIRTVFAYSGQQKEYQRFQVGLDSAYKHGVKRNIFSGFNLGFTWMSGYLGFAICLLYSTKFYKNENYGSYDEAAIITILWSAAGCVFLLNRMMPFIEVIQMARGSAANIFSVIERDSKIDVTSCEGLRPKHFEAHVNFDQVSFTYPLVDETIENNNENNSNFSQRASAAAAAKANNTIGKHRKSLSPISSGSGSSSSAENNAAHGVVGMSPKNIINITNSQASSSSSSCQTQPLTSSHGQEDTDHEEEELPETNKATLVNVSMEVRPGQTVALVGPSGSGKSTALSLLQRFFEIQLGSIAIGGYDIRQLNLAWLREQFGVVTQEPVLFDMSIGDNIKLGARPGQRVTQQDIELAARNANAHYFIKRLPAGYDTRAGTRGIQLSGGQKQRIAIARALIRQPKLLLLDEATSALDLESESIVQRALDQARIGRTTFIVAHRLSTVRNADKIIVFDKGTIVESGTHEELLQKRGLYYQINAQQKHGLDLAAPTNLGNIRRNSLLDSLRDTRESRSLSIYSTGAGCGKYKGFGAAGHGGNGEGLSEADQHGSSFHQDEERSFAAAGSGLYGDMTDHDLDHHHLTGAPVKGDQIQGWPEGAGESLPLIDRHGRRVCNLSICAILRFIKPNLMFTTIGIFTSLLMGLCIPISAIIIGDIANLFSTDNPEKIRHGLYTHGLLYMVLAGFAFAISFVQVLTFGTAGEKIGIHLRISGFKAILRRNITWFDNKRNSPGALCARLASDVGNVQTITGSRTAVIFQSISILVTTLIFAIYFNVKFSSLCALFVGILLMTTVLQAHYAGKLTMSNREFDSNIGKIVLESSANIKTVVSLHQEEYFIQRFEQLLQTDRRCFKMDNHIRLIMESFKYAMTAISKGSAFYFAAHMLLRNEITIDVIFKLIEIILYGLTEASKSLIFISDLEKARRGAQNLYKLIYTEQYYDMDSLNNNNNNNNSEYPYEHDTKNTMKIIANDDDNNDEHGIKRASYFLCPTMFGGHHQFGNSMTTDIRTLNANNSKIIHNANYYANTNTNCRGNIRFENVSFAYPTRPSDIILRSLNADIPAGKSIALVGRSGCGKSTIVQLLECFYQHSNGLITLDGQDLRHLPVEWLRKQIALVSQEPTLLSYTIGDNIRYGDNSRFVPHDEVVKAAQTAQIHEFIMSLPDGYDTKLSEANSMQLSGGQKQRIAIARALIRRAPIMVFDEATSALDSKSENIVQRALERAQLGKTSIMIAHRLSTIKNADRILVLKDGVVIEQGTHQELLERRAEYYRLFKTQSKCNTNQ